MALGRDWLRLIFLLRRFCSASTIATRKRNVVAAFRSRSTLIAKARVSQLAPGWELWILFIRAADQVPAMPAGCRHPSPIRRTPERRAGQLRLTALIPTTSIGVFASGSPPLVCDRAGWVPSSERVRFDRCRAGRSYLAWFPRMPQYLQRMPVRSRITKPLQVW